MDQDRDGRIFLTPLLDVPELELRVDRAAPLPHDHLRAPDLVFGEPPQRARGIPHDDPFHRDPHLDRRVPSQVLVGEEEDRLALGERPLEHRPAVRGGAYRAVTLAAERLQLGGRVHVGDRHERDTEPVEGLSRVEHVVGPRHVRHGASGVHVGEDHRLVGLAEDVRALRHEVDAAEDDPSRVLPLGAETGELVRVPGDVGVLDDVVPLVVVPQDDERRSERAFRFPIREAIVGSSSSRYVSGTVSPRTVMATHFDAVSPPVKRKNRTPPGGTDHASLASKTSWR